MKRTRRPTRRERKNEGASTAAPRTARSDELLAAQLMDLERQNARAVFRAKFGRDPEKGEPLAFDPDADVPTPRAKVSVAAKRRGLRSAGIPPHLAHAIAKTELFVTSENMDTYTDDEVRRWNEALDEFDTWQLAARLALRNGVSPPMAYAYGVTGRIEPVEYSIDKDRKITANDEDMDWFAAFSDWVRAHPGPPPPDRTPRKRETTH